MTIDAEIKDLGYGELLKLATELPKLPPGFMKRMEQVSPILRELRELREEYSSVNPGGNAMVGISYRRELRRPPAE